MTLQPTCGLHAGRAIVDANARCARTSGLHRVPLIASIFMALHSARA